MSDRRPPPRTRFHPERLLPYACIVAALALFASELTITFQFSFPGGEPLCAQEAADRHEFAMGVIALFAIGAVIVAVLELPDRRRSRSQWPAWPPWRCF